MIFEQGVEGKDFCVVLRGRVEIGIRGNNGFLNKVAEVTAGQSFGELALRQEKGIRQACVISIEPTELLVMTKENYKKCLSHYREEMAEHTLKFLLKIDGFKTVTPEKLKALSFVINYSKYAAGEDIWKEGTVLDQG